MTLRENARTTRSVIDAGTYVGQAAQIEGAVIGRSCEIRSHVQVHEGVAIGDEVHDRLGERDRGGGPHLPEQGDRARLATCTST